MEDVHQFNQITTQLTEQFLSSSLPQKLAFMVSLGLVTHDHLEGNGEFRVESQSVVFAAVLKSEFFF